MSTLRLALAQINVTVGDIEGNVEKIKIGLDQAREAQADVVLFPELALSGYPPEDLLLKPNFAAANRAALEGLAPFTTGLTAVIGFVDRRSDVYNAAAVLHDGAIVGIYHKSMLPNYAVFDEDRYFDEGDTPLVFNRPNGQHTATLGVSICEDIWYPGWAARSAGCGGS